MGQSAHPASGTLASRRATWQGGAMASSPPPAAGGFLVAVGILGGAAVGFAVGDPTRGLLIGLAAGTALAIAIWWRGRR